jgi:hypothetical protein
MAKDNPGKKAAQEVNEELGYLEDQLISIADQLSTKIKDSINEIRDESKGVAEIFGKNLNKSIKDIARGSDKILSNTAKLATGAASIKDIQKSQLETQVKQLAAERNLTVLLNQELISKEDYKKYQAEINEATETQNKLIEAQLKQAVKIKSNMGITGNLIKGISKIPVLGNFLDAEEALAKAQIAAAKEGGNRTNVMGAAFKQLGKSLKENLTDPLTIMAVSGKALASIFGFIKKSFLDFDKASVNIARNFGSTPQSARELTHEFRQISANSDNILSTVGNLSDAFAGLNSVAGTFANFGQESVETYNNLTKGLGLSEQAAQGIYKFSVLQGKEFGNFSKELAGQLSLRREQSGVTLSDKAIYESLTQLSAQQRLNIKGGTQGLVDSVIEAKKLGAEFSDLNTAANSLLQFESSIGAELEAELLTGRSLNLERARAAALAGDQASLARELKEQLGTAEEFSKMNVIQQESLAKAFGMSADQVAGMLEKQEMLNAANKAGFKDVDSIAEAYAKAADKEAFLAKIGDDRLKSQVQNLTFQEKINALLEKFKDIFVQKLEPMFNSVLSKFDEFIKGGGITKIANVAKTVGSVFVSIGKVLTGPIGKIIGGLAAFGALKMLVGGIPVRVVGGGPMGGAGGRGGMGGGLMSSLYQKGTPGKFYKGGQFLPGGGRAPVGGVNVGGMKGGLTRMGGGLLGMAGGALASMAGGALTDAGYGTAGGALSMGGQGLAMGAMFGPIGMLVGGLGGAILGGIQGHYEQESKDRVKQQEKANKMAARPIMDFKRRLAATTSQDARYESLTGHGGEVDGTEKTNMLLEKLVNISEQGGTINIDGNKAGTQMGRAIYVQS